MNRQTKRLLAKQEKRAERERARQAASGGRGGAGKGPGGRGPGGRGPGGAGGGGAAGGAGPAKAPKSEREGRITRIRRFFREVRQELKKVAWPTRAEVATYTVVVLVSVTFVTLLVFGLDYLFGEGAFALFSTD